MSSVGYGADVGLHPVSSWNNPKPEVALLVISSGRDHWRDRWAMTLICATCKAGWRCC